MRKKNVIVEKVTVQDIASAGKALARVDGKVFFMEGAVPGDVVDIRLSKNKKDWAEGKVIHFHELSKDRVLPFCEHFGICGGCKWQMLPYEKQLEYKQNEVEQHLRRIGKIALPVIEPIIGCSHHTHYRNKLEFTFSNKRFLLPGEIKEGEPIPQENALGFHVPKIFDKVVDIKTCYLMDEPTNAIRNTIRAFALSQGYSFYDIKQHTGWLRNITLRICSTGDVMVNVVFNYEDKTERIRLFEHLLEKVPSVTTLLYTINPKFNDSIYDLEPQVYTGKGYAIENLEDFKFKIGPKSFFQTNTRQGARLYEITREFAELTGKETVYDLYCGTGSIGIFVSGLAKKVIGVEVVEEAVEDARENASMNGVQHASFFAGDVTYLCDDDFFAAHGKPDVIITDPPRAGMHELLIAKILEMEAPLLVYVSCNPSTQARDLLMLDDKYRVTRVQPVDMFPHTHHIENVVQLRLREEKN